MKNLSFITVVIFIFITNTFSQNKLLTLGKSNNVVNESILTSKNYNQIIIRFKINELDLVEVETDYGKAFITTSNKAPLMLQEGSPELFYLTESFIIPDTGSSDLDISYGKYIDFENIEIAPSKGNISRNTDHKTVPFVKGNVYKKDEFYPGILASLREPFIMRDIRGQSVDIYPVQYNPVTKVLRVYDEITVTVSNNNHIEGINEFTGQKRHNNIDSEFNEIYNNLFINHSVIQVRNYPTGEEGELLIICHPTYMDAMKPFIDWKRAIGRRTTMVSTATTGISSSSIKNYISNYYNNPANNLAYVLLVGSNTQINMHEYTNQFYNSNNPYDPTVGSDNYYGQLTGNDKYMEVLIGRMSAETVEQIQTQVQRTIWYESDITTSDTWLNNSIGLASSEQPTGGHDGDEADYVHINNIRNRLINYGYSTVHQEYNGNCPGVSNTTAAQISARFNNGVSIANYCNHGFVTGWAIRDYPNDIFLNYTNTHINSLSNTGRLPYIFSVACLVGRIKGLPGSNTSSTCFAETWLRATQSNQPTGAVATLMSTIALNWQPPMTAQDEFVDLCLGITHTAGGTNYGIPNITLRTFAGTAINATQKMLLVHTPDSRNTHDFDAWSVFGDPTLMIRTRTPQTMTVTHNPNVLLGSTTFSVSCNVNGALVTMSFKNGNNDVQILGTATVSGGVANLTFTPITSTNPIRVTVIGRDRVTYQGTVFAHCYSGLPIVYGKIIQNTSWNTPVHVIGDIVVSSGFVLNVSSTVVCNPDIKITIEPNAKLYINNGTIKSQCNQLWQGILVKGNSSLQQTSSNQGSVELQNATIENAICAIKVEAGGIVKTYNSTFNNNLCAIEYLPYVYSQGSIFYDNVGLFHKCTFKIDNNNLFTPAQQTSIIEVKLNGVRGIFFEGCTFKTEALSNGKGIFAQDAGFKVKNTCTGLSPGDCACSVNSTTPTFFYSFYNGIHSNNTGNPHGIMIDQSNFRKNRVSVDIKSSNNYQLTRCELDSIGLGTGLKSENSSGYRIEENKLTGVIFPPGPQPVMIGIDIINSGGAENRIYKNTFVNLNNGISASGINAEPSYPYIGLQFFCNSFENCERDISVSSFSTVRKQQGDDDLGADNKFSQTAISSFYNYNNSFIIGYDYSPAPLHQPFNPVYVNTYGLVAANPCKSTFCLPRPKETSVEEKHSDYIKIQNEYDNLFNEFENLGYRYIAENIYNNEFPEELVSEALKFLSKISRLSDSMRELRDNSIRSLMLDSIMDISLLKSWYEIVRSPISKYLLTETELYTNNYERADAVLHQIPEMFVFGEYEMAEHDNYILFHNFKKQLQLEERDWSELNEAEISYLQTIAEANTGRSSTMAKGVLCFFFNICYDDDSLPPAPSEVGGETRNSETRNFELETLNQKPVREFGLSIHPNPANTEITVSIVSSKVRIDKVEFYDIFGQVIILQNFNKSQDVVPIRNISDGIYIIKVYLSNGVVENKKVVIQHNKN